MGVGVGVGEDEGEDEGDEGDLRCGCESRWGCVVAYRYLRPPPPP